jgi:parallel beta-helix repeat protein
VKKLLFGFILLFFAPTGAGAATWYVAKTGSDSNSCAQAQNSSTPRLTINGALACAGFFAGAGAGHTVQVASGTYAETISRWPSGTSGNPFTLRSATPYGAIIKPGTVSTQILYLDSGYVTVDGFVIDGTNVNANNVWFNNGAIEVTLQNCEIKNVRTGDGTGTGSFQAIYSIGATNLTIRNNQIHDIGTSYSNHASHGIYWSSSNSVIEGNTIYKLSGSGIQIYTEYAGSLNNNTVKGNRIYDFGKGGSATGVYISRGTNNVAYNNVIYQSAFNASAYGISIKDTGNKAFNNTVYNNAVGIDVGGTSTTVQNNILWKNGFTFAGSGHTVDHNLVNTDPRFVNLSAFDFRLQSTSPAIDAGMAITQVSTDLDGMTRPYGSGFDLGAFEYRVATAPAAPTNVHIQR